MIFLPVCLSIMGPNGYREPEALQDEADQSNDSSVTGPELEKGEGVGGGKEVAVEVVTVKPVQDTVQPQS